MTNVMVRKSNLYRLKELFLLLFIFSLPFEYWDPIGVRSFFTITKLIGFLYMAISLIDIKESFSLKYVRKPILLLMLLWLLLVFMSIINDRHGGSISVIHTSFFQNVILFWLISNDLINSPKLQKRTILSFILGVLSMSVLISFGVGLENSIDRELGEYRVRFFGSNPNGVGNLAAVALFFAFHMFLMRKKYYGKKTLMILLSFPSLLALLSFSGSRGALLVSGIGIISLILFQKGSTNRRLVSLTAGTVFLLYGINILMQSSVLQNRVQQSIEEGTLGGREDIWKHAWDIFTENPLLGAGSTGYYHEMVQRYGVYMDTHNLFLYFMATTGILGLIIYLFFIYNLFSSAKRYYNNNRDILLFGVLLIYIFSVFKSGGALNSKLFWILAALINGIGHYDKVSNEAIIN